MPKKKPGGPEPLEPLHLLEDEPVLHHADDGLGLLSFARVIAGAAVGTGGPFNIGVFADWGQGKTSVLRQAKSLIDDDPAHSAVVTVWFNAWQYEKEEHPIVPLVASIVREVERKQVDAKAKLGAKLKSAYADTVRALRAVAYGFSAKARVKIPGLGEVESGFVAKEMVERFEKLAPGGDPLLDQSLYHHAFETLAKLGARGAAEKDAASPKIVVFIDDLDRCLPDQGLKLLESLKLVLAQPGFIFVLAVDRRILEGYLRKRYRDDFGVADYDASGTSYLDKIVQLPLGLPSHAGRFEEYIEHVLGLPALAESNADVRAALAPLREVIAAGAAYNPRSLVRLVNNLIVDQRIWVADQEAEDPVRLLGLCAVSRILRERLRPDLYRALVEDRELCEEIAAGKEPLEVALERRGKEGERRGFREERRARVIARLAEAELGAVIGTGAGRAWLTDHQAREAFDQFLVSRGERIELLEVPRYLREAIRRALGKKKGETIRPEDRASVKSLHLGSSAINDDDLALLSDLVSLNRLDLAHTDVSSEGIRSLAGLSQLESLSLSHTRISNLGLWSLANLKNLARLDLSNTEISGAGLEWLVGLKNLADLDLSATKTDDDGLEWLALMTSLKALNLSATKVTDRGVGKLSSPDLEELFLIGLAITDRALIHVARLRGLKRLSVSGAAITDGGLRHLSSLPELESLGLGETDITDSGLEYLSGMKTLSRLDLWGTGITDEGVASLSTLTGLQRLNLQNTQIADPGLKALVTLVDLAVLDLSGTKITDEGLSPLSELPQLTFLELSDTSITDEGLPALAALGGLSQLGLAYTSTTPAGQAKLKRALPELAIYA